MTDKMLEAFAGTRKAGSIASGALDEVAKLVKPGVTTEQIDKLCYEFINDHKAYSAPLFYRGYPKSCCTSTNHVVCHGIPKDKFLSEGDIVNVDVTALKRWVAWRYKQNVFCWRSINKSKSVSKNYI